MSHKLSEQDKKRITIALAFAVVKRRRKNSDDNAIFLRQHVLPACDGLLASLIQKQQPLPAVGPAKTAAQQQPTSAKAVQPEVLHAGNIESRVGHLLTLDPLAPEYEVRVLEVATFLSAAARKAEAQPAESKVIDAAFKLIGERLANYLMLENETFVLRATSALNAVINKSKESAIHQLRRPLIRLLIACVTGVCSLVQAQKPSDVEDSRSRSSSSSSSKRIKHSKSGDQGAVTLCNCAYTISLLRSTVAAALKGDKVAKRADNAVWLLEMLAPLLHATSSIPLLNRALWQIEGEVQRAACASAEIIKAPPFSSWHREQASRASLRVATEARSG